MTHWFKPSIFWLFIFIPTTILLEFSSAADPLVFFSAALAIIPIAKLIVLATEHLAAKTGDAIGGLLNATFGNAPEFIISIVALKSGLHEMLLASLVGAILANLLLAQGLAFFTGGLKYKIQEYNVNTISMYNSMLLIAMVSLLIPSAFSDFFSSDEFITQTYSLNKTLACALLLMYALYLLFMLKTHPDFFKSIHKSHKTQIVEKEAEWSIAKALTILLISSVLAAWMSELLVGAATGTGEALGMSSIFIGIIFVAMIGGVAETFSAIEVARKDNMDLGIGIAVGSSIQIALFLTPLLVLISYVVGPHPMNLSFGKTEIIALFMAIFVSSSISGDGKSNWYKGAQLIIMYAIIALMFYFIPEQ